MKIKIFIQMRNHNMKNDIFLRKYYFLQFFFVDCCSRSFEQVVKSNRIRWSGRLSRVSKIRRKRRGKTRKRKINKLTENQLISYNLRFRKGCF